MKAKVSVVVLILVSFLLTAKAGSLIYDNWQHDLRLQLAKYDLENFWQKIDRTETPTVIIDGQSVAGDSIGVRRLWENQEQAEKEHRQEIVTLTNEQREVVNKQENETYPLLELQIYPLLEQSARQAFENIAETKRFEHQDMTALLTKGEPFNRVGENLAAELYVNPVRTVYDFYLSEAHREVMLGDWEYIGVWSGWVDDLVREGKEPQDFYVTVVHFGE